MLTAKIWDSGKNKNKIICLVCWEPYFCTLHMFCYLSPNKASLLWTYISTGIMLLQTKVDLHTTVRQTALKTSQGHMFSLHLIAWRLAPPFLLCFWLIFQDGIVHRHFQKREWQQMWRSSRCFSAVYQWAQRGRGAKRHCWCKAALQVSSTVLNDTRVKSYWHKRHRLWSQHQQNDLSDF